MWAAALNTILPGLGVWPGPSPRMLCLLDSTWPKVTPCITNRTTCPPCPTSELPWSLIQLILCLSPSPYKKFSGSFGESQGETGRMEGRKEYEREAEEGA